MFRFLLILFTASSLIATVCCIMMSPHFPESDGDHSEDDVFDQHEELVETDYDNYHDNYHDDNYHGNDSTYTSLY